MRGAVRRLVPGMLALLVVGCASHRGVGGPPERVVVVAIAPTVNATGNALPLSGDSLLGRLLGEPRLSVGEYMATRAATLLETRGYVVHREAEDLPRLGFEIEGWETDVPALQFVVVTASAHLRAAHGEAPLWEVGRTRWIVPTRGAASIAGARRLAADQIVEELLAGWRGPATQPPVHPEP